jgi:hypothetical protein
LIGEDRKWRAGRQNGAIDPIRTLGRSVWGRLAALSHLSSRPKVLGLRRR